jgi:hypothetical protein
MKRQYVRRTAMLDTRESARSARTRERGPEEVRDPAAGTVSRGATEVLLGVLGSLESYEACILEAERDGDLEVADFLRELRRQDLVRAREATRLLRRSLEASYTDAEEEAVC